VSRKRTLPSVLTSVPKVTATPYRVKRAGRIWNVWKFVGWGKGGWLLIEKLNSSDDALQFILRRHGLEVEEPEPIKVQMVVYGFPIWDAYGGI
jgi:hypothetical protein